jgi:hypothetical protein
MRETRLSRLLAGMYGGVHRTSLYLIDQVRCQIDSLSSQFIIVQTWVRTEAS